MTEEKTGLPPQPGSNKKETWSAAGKNGIKKNLLWLWVPLLLGAVQSAGLFWPVKPSAPAARPSGEVLGVTDIRGHRPLLKPVLANPPADKELAAVSAKSYLVYEPSSGTVLAANNPEEKMAIASLTKLMTALVAYENLDLGSELSIRRAGLTSVRPAVGFMDGDLVKASDVFFATVVGSCNDASQALARAVKAATGQDPVELMNEKAKSLGMLNTNFSNPMGFDSQTNYSTAADLRRLADATQELAAFANLGRAGKLNFSGKLGHLYTVRPTNRLLNRFPDLLSIKTGYTEGAQGAMVSKVSRGPGRHVVIIVLGSEDREKDTALLKSLIADRTEWR